MLESISLDMRRNIKENEIKVHSELLGKKEDQQRLVIKENQ